MPLRTFVLPILLGTVLGLAVVAAWLAPSWLDVERFRPQVAAALAETLGRPVAIEGRLSVAMLPRPVVMLHGVRLTGEPSALLEVAAVEATLDPLALLQGRATVTRLVLDRPLLAAAGLAEDAAGWIRHGAAGQGPQQIVVRGGIVVRGDENRAPLLAGLQVEIEATAIGAPYRLKGEAHWRDMPVGFDGSVGLPTAAATPVSLVVRLRDAKAEFKLSGQLGDDALRGKLALSGEDINALLRRLDLGFVLPSAAKTDFAVQANATVDGRTVAFEAAEGHIGDSRAGGALSLALGDEPRGALTLSFASLDLDQWIAGAPPAAAPSVWTALLRDVPFSLDVSADALIVRKSVLRQARLDAQIEAGVARIGQLSALLPGNSMAIGFGEVDLAATEPRVAATFEATSDNLRAVLGWLGLSVAQVPADRLRVLAVSGRLAGTAKEMRLSDLDLRVDTAHVTGAVTLRRDERLAFGINLTAPSLNLDAYWRRGEAPFDMAALRDAAAGIDANVRVALGQLTLNDTTVRDLLLDATIVNGEVMLRQASFGDIGGAAVRLTGGIGGLAQGGLELRDLRYDVRSVQPDKLLRLLDVTLPFPAERLGGVAATGRVDGDGRLLTLEVAGEAAGAAFSLAGAVADLFAAPRWDVKLRAQHDSLAAMVKLLLPDYRPTAELGGFRLETTLGGTAEEMAASELLAVLGPVTVDGLAYLSLAGKPVITASLTAGAVDVGAFLPARPAAAGLRGWSKDSVDLGWLRGLEGTLALDAPSARFDRQRLDRPQLRLSVHDGMAVLDQLHGALGDGRLSAHGRIDAEGAAELSAELEGARLSAPLFRLGGLDVVGGRVDAALQLKTEGRSPFEMLSRLSGAARLEVRDGAVTGFSLAEVSQRLAKATRPADVPSLLQAGMTQGRTPFSRLSGRFAVNAGVVGSEDLVLEGEGGSATGIATASLSAETLDARLVFRLTDQPQAPGFVMALDGSLDRPRRSFDPADLEAWVARRDAGKLLDQPDQPAAGVMEKVIDSVSR